MPATEFTVFETVETKAMTCDLGCTHQRVKVLRRYDLAVVETRPVRNLYLEAYGRTVGGTGYRAIDQFGQEWRASWDGANGDGGDTQYWTALDGRKAEAGFGLAGDVRPRASSGYVIENG